MRKLVVVIGLVVCFSSSSFAEPAPEVAPAPELTPATEPAPAPAPAPAPEITPATEPAPAPAPAPAQPAAAKQAVPAPTAVFAPTPSTYGPPSLADDAVAAAVVKRGRLDENTALTLSLAGTFGGWALAYGSVKSGSGAGLLLGAAGLVLGPNAGHWYRGAVFTRGTGLRIIAMLATAYGFMRESYCETSCRDSDAYILIGGALLFVGATVDDIVRAPLKVREHNRRLESLSVAPMVTDRGGGLALGGRF